VPEVPASSTLHQRHQIERARRSLGKIADSAVGPAVTAAGPHLWAVHVASPAPASTFPLGAQTRKADASGRIKLHTDPALADVLGWHDGALDAVFSGGWLVLRQSPHHIGATSARNGATARYSREANGLERVALKPAHLERLALGADRYLLVAPAPTGPALLVVNSVVCLAGAPRLVTDALHADPNTLTPTETNR